MNRTSLVRTTGLAALTAVVAACGGTAESEAPRTATVPAGTEMVVRLDQELSTRSHRKGDEFTARLASSVRSETSAGETAAKVGGSAPAGTDIVLAEKDGHAVLPAGSGLRLELTEPLTVPVDSRDEGSGATGEAT